MSSANTSHTNRLAREVSPYLLQHQHNPVDWWPWGPDALAEAKRSGRPILLSVGYAACHWCHVMAHESFEDEATARVMNELFVNIKVDREERPDIDQIYMNALHLLGEQGGWPLTMFLSPDGEPVWGGTYFPKESRYGRPAFVDVLKELSRLFREEPDRIAQNRAALMEKLGAAARPENKVVIGLPELDQAAASLARQMDPVNGGAARCAEIPAMSDARVSLARGIAAQRSALLRYRRAHADADLRRRYLRPSWRRLLALFGGREMAGPAFRKDALRQRPASRVAGAGPCTDRQRPCSGRGRRKPLGWLDREMTTPEGAFSASLDADLEGEEGKFYVWSLAEVQQILGPEDAAFFAAHYDVTAEGNFEGHNILNCLKDLPRSMEDAIRLSALRPRLLQEREKRVRPGLDDKVLADWNGLMIAALVNAGTLLDAPEWIAKAKGAFDAIVRLMGRVPESATGSDTSLAGR